MDIGQSQPDKASKAPRPSERAPILIRTRNLKMARLAHAYVRGSTVKFYEWLEASAGKLPSGDAKGLVDIQIRDLDQTVIGNPAHDLIRLGLSLASAGRGSDLPGHGAAGLSTGRVDRPERVRFSQIECIGISKPTLTEMPGKAYFEEDQGRWGLTPPRAGRENLRNTEKGNTGKNIPPALRSF